MTVKTHFSNIFPLAIKKNIRKDETSAIQISYVIELLPHGQI